MTVEEETEEDTGPVAGRKKGSSKSGWCLSSMDRDSHSRCPVTIGQFSCSCTCGGHGSRSGQTPQWQLEPIALSEEELDHEPEPTASA